MTAVAAGVATALLLAIFATLALSGKTPVMASENSSVQLSQIVVVPPRAKCAKAAKKKGAPSPNCITQKCCQLSALKCYEIHSGYAKCMKKCTPGKDGTCLVLEHTSPAEKSDVTYSTTNMFCWSFYQAVTGSTTPSYDLELLRTNVFLGTSIFGCESYRVFSDAAATWLSPGEVETVQVEDVENNFYYAKRKFNGYWINANMHIAAWKKIKEEDMYSSKDWTVKVDTDAVFLPSRLRTILDTTEVTPNGIYIENCKYQNWGFYGALEVISLEGAKKLMANLDVCKKELNYMGSDEKILRNEPWGEDVFVQRCMDLHGVDKVSNFHIAKDSLCLATVPEGQKKNKKFRHDCSTVKTEAIIHTFHSPKNYFNCLKLTQQA